MPTIVDYLLTKGADVHHHNNVRPILETGLQTFTPRLQKGVTPLHLAVHNHDQYSILAMILHAGANIHARDNVAPISL
jgi:ankyrin repeat protein